MAAAFEDLPGDVRAGFDAGRTRAFTVPVRVKPVDAEPACPEFDVYLERDDTLSLPDQHFVREGIPVSGVRGALPKGMRAIVVAHHPPTSATSQSACGASISATGRSSLNQRIGVIGEVARSDEALLAPVYPEVVRRILREIVVEQGLTDPDFEETEWTRRDQGGHRAALGAGAPAARPHLRYPRDVRARDPRGAVTGVRRVAPIAAHQRARRRLRPTDSVPRRWRSRPSVGWSETAVGQIVRRVRQGHGH